MTLDQQEPPRALSAAQPQNPAPRAGEHSLPSDFHSTTASTFQKRIKHAVNAVCPEERQQTRRMPMSTSDAVMEGIRVDQGPPHPLCFLTPPRNLLHGTGQAGGSSPGRHPLAHPQFVFLIRCRATGGGAEVSIPSQQTAIKQPDPHTLNYSRAARGAVYQPG